MSHVIHMCTNQVMHTAALPAIEKRYGATTEVEAETLQ